MPAASYDQLVRTSGLALLEARALMEHASGRGRSWLIAHGDEAPGEAIATSFEALAARRRAGEPIAYLLGWREFHGRRFLVGPEVLIPRPETELLVELAIARLPPDGRLADLGTGSGCIGLTIAAERPDAHAVLTDASAAALGIAWRNAQALGVATRARASLGDWCAALAPGDRFEVVASNPPYIAGGDAHLSEGDLRFEPRGALTDAADGLAAIRRIVACAPGRLAPGGWLLLEHGWDQGEAVRAILQAAGAAQVTTWTDLAGHERVSGGCFSSEPRRSANDIAT